MNKRYIPVALFYLLLLTSAISCKKDEAVVVEELQVASFSIDKLSRTFAQAGDEVTLTGTNLIQDDLKTEVFVNGRPAEIVSKQADNISIRIPEQSQTGKVMLTISKGKLFKTVYGPSIEIKATPVVKGFWPLYAFAGETIDLYTENFSNNNNDNAIFLGDKKVEIISRDANTLRVKLPADAANGIFSWNTFNGPVYRLDSTFRVRQTNYPANTVADYLQQDPAFSFMDTLVRGFYDLADSYHYRVYDSAMKYMKSADKAYTVFLPADQAYYSTNVTKTAFVNGIKQRPYNYNTLLIAAIALNHSINLDTVQNGSTYITPYTMKMQWDGQGTDDANFIRIIVENGEKYAQIEGMYGETRPPVKIIREYKIGNATMIELATELGYVSF